MRQDHIAQSKDGAYFDLEQESERLRLDKSADMIKASRRFLVSQTSWPIGDRRRVSCNLPTLLDHLPGNDL